MSPASAVLPYSWWLRVPALIFGVLFLYLALLLYPDERGRIQNRLVDLWVMFSRKGENALGQTGKLISGAAKVVNDFLDRLYGQRLISVRAFVASCALSVASAALVVGILFRSYELPEQWKFFTLSMAASLTVIVVTVLYAFATRLKTVLVSIGLPCFALSLWHFLNLHGVDNPDPEKMIPLTVWIIAAGVVSDLLFVALIRKLLRWTSSVTSAWKLGVGILTVLFIGVVLTGPAIYVFINLEAFTDTGRQVRDLIVDGYFFASSTNAVAAFVSVLVVVIFGVALFNRLIWSFIARPVYLLVDFGVLNNRKLLGTIGSVLLVFAFPSSADWISKIKDLPW